MTIITPDLARRFVRDVNLPKVRALRRDLADKPPIELKANEAQSLVVGSGLVVAAEKVPVQTREDLINCMLFAQLAATAAGYNPKEIGQWYDAFFKTLTALGWAQSDTQFQDYKFNSLNVEAHKAVMQVLTAMMGPEAAALVIVKAALEALQSMSENTPWITLFDHQSMCEKFARFQVAAAQVDPNGLLQVALVGFQLKAKSTLTQVLFFKFSSNSTSLKYAAGRATIYDAALAGQRDLIAKRLAEYRNAYVAQIALPPPPVRGARALRRGESPARLLRRSAIGPLLLQ